MRTWLTLRLEGDAVACTAYRADDLEDSDGVTHTVTESVPVELPAAAKAALDTALTDAAAALAKRMKLATARHTVVVEEQLGRQIAAEAKQLAGGLTASTEFTATKV